MMSGDVLRVLRVWGTREAQSHAICCVYVDGLSKHPATGPPRSLLCPGSVHVQFGQNCNKRIAFCRRHCFAPLFAACLTARRVKVGLLHCHDCSGCSNPTQASSDSNLTENEWGIKTATAARRWRQAGKAVMCSSIRGRLECHRTYF